MSLRNLLKTILPILIITGFVALGVGQVQTDRELKLENTIELKSRESQLIELNNKYEDVLQKKTDTQKERDEQSKQIEELESERERLQRELQAKRAREAQEEENARRTALVQSQRVSAASSSDMCEQWKAQAGIPSTHATRTLISKESGCRPNAVNPTSGACGIPQAYPCSKLPCSLDDAGAVCQLIWMKNYVADRYGSWDNALSFWYSKCSSPQGCWY